MQPLGGNVPDRLYLLQTPHLGYRDGQPTVRAYSGTRQILGVLWLLYAPRGPILDESDREASGVSRFVAQTKTSYSMEIR